MTFSDETLMAYADDELDPEARAAVEAAMASDPEIARRVAQHSALRKRIRCAFDRILEEPVPPRLVPPVRGGPTDPLEDPLGAKLVPLRRGRAARQWAWPQWTAIAASLILGVIVGGAAVLRARAPAVIAMTGGQAVAAGMLASALSDQLAGSPSTAGGVRIGVSFRSKAGEFCRTFILRQPAPLAGLACRAAGSWQLGVLARASPPGGEPGAYRQAASTMPPAVIAAVESRIAGQPLDSRAEAAARARNWQP